MGRFVLAVVLTLSFSGCVGEWQPLEDPCSRAGSYVNEFALSPDGRLVAFTYANGVYAELRIVDLENRTARTLVSRPAADLTNPFFAQDATSVVFVATEFTGTTRGWIFGTDNNITAVSTVERIRLSDGRLDMLVGPGEHVTSAAQGADDELLIVRGSKGLVLQSCYFVGGDLISVSPRGTQMIASAQNAPGAARSVAFDSLGTLRNGTAVVWQESGYDPSVSGTYAQVNHLHRRTGTLSQIVPRASTAGPPHFAPCTKQENSVVFTEAVDGEWQPMVVDADTRVVRQVMNVPGGAFGACLVPGAVGIVYLSGGNLMHKRPMAPAEVIFPPTAPMQR